MKLLLPKVIANLTKIAREQRGEAGAIANEIIPKLHRAEKFVFDSGMDRDESVTTAFRETAVNMMEAGLFHLPYPVIWVEDPFGDGDDRTMPDGSLMPEGIKSETRYMYYCEESHDQIRIWFLSDPDETIVMLPAPIILDLTKAEDAFFYPPENPQQPEWIKIAGEAVYAVKKFIVTLATRGVEKTQVKGGRHDTNITPRGRRYPHTVVRIPMDYSSAKGSGGHGQHRRMHLVRGYVWGKNTRPLNEQRWIDPFFRGMEELGTVEHSRYVVKEPA